MSLASLQQGEAGTMQKVHQVGDIEQLRQILSEKSESPVSFEEAKEVGAALIEFYELLAMETEDECTD